MLVVRAEEISDVECGPVREEVPLVEVEPHLAGDGHVEDERDELGEEEHRERSRFGRRRGAGLVAASVGSADAPVFVDVDGGRFG